MLVFGCVDVIIVALLRCVVWFGVPDVFGGLLLFGSCVCFVRVLLSVCLCVLRARCALFGSFILCWSVWCDRSCFLVVSCCLVWCSLVCLCCCWLSCCDRSPPTVRVMLRLLFVSWRVLCLLCLIACACLGVCGCFFGCFDGSVILRCAMLVGLVLCWLCCCCPPLFVSCVMLLVCVLRVCLRLVWCLVWGWFNVVVVSCCQVWFV